MVFSVKLHLGLIPWPLTLDTWPLSLIPNPCSLSPSRVPYKKFRWGLLWLSLWLFLLLLSKVKVKSTPSLRPMTWSLTKDYFIYSFQNLLQNYINSFIYFWHFKNLARQSQNVMVTQFENEGKSKIWFVFFTLILFYFQLYYTRSLISQPTLHFVDI